MAEKYRFYKISEANAEIAKLEEKITALESQANAATENDSEIAEQATALQSQVKSLQELITGKDAEIAALKAGIDTAKAEVAALPAKIEAEASKQALSIVASQGVKAPLKSDPAAEPGKQTEPKLSNLTGLARTEAAFKAQSAAKLQAK